MIEKHCSDQELRMMRNAVYPATSSETFQSDPAWEQVKDNWRRDEEWLTNEFMKLKPMKWKGNQ